MKNLFDFISKTIDFIDKNKERNAISRLIFMFVTFAVLAFGCGGVYLTFQIFLGQNSILLALLGGLVGLCSFILLITGITRTIITSIFCFIYAFQKKEFALNLTVAILSIVIFLFCIASTIVALCFLL